MLFEKWKIFHFLWKRIWIDLIFIDKLKINKSLHFLNPHTALTIIEFSLNKINRWVKCICMIMSIQACCFQWDFNENRFICVLVCNHCCCLVNWFPCNSVFCQLCIVFSFFLHLISIKSNLQQHHNKNKPFDHTVRYVIDYLPTWMIVIDVNLIYS